MASYLNKEFEFELLEALIGISDPKVHQTLFLNLVFYTLAKRTRSKQEIIKSIGQTETLIKDLFKCYFNS